ncbi:MAG: AAA family ATPase, partial [Epsilonproteobacteria bacterium]|nr:AAA family ATPase [Campylobacterota bacterium]
QYLCYVDKINFIGYVKDTLFSTDSEFENYNYDNDSIYSEHFIFFSKEHFKILQNNIQKSSIFITLEENIDKFLEHENSNVKPIFLKRIEDVDTLLNVLQKDIQQEKYAKTEKEEIVTIDKILVENFFSMEHVKLDNLKDKKEIYIVGENGDGKTLLLQSIAIGLAGVKEGDVFNLTKAQEKLNIEIVDSKKTKHTKDKNIYEYIFAYGASRYNSCQMKEDETGYLTLFENRYDLRSPVEWLQYLDHNEKSGKENIVSVIEAKTLLNKLLNRDVAIEITPDNVIFKEKGSEVSFEQLSAGYKGVITIICDLIARLYEKQPYVVDVKDFKGVVLIDEVELHLHPKWKYDFMRKLRETFPLIQFIVTTHSPTVILGASKEAVFYKIYKDNGKVTISNQIANEGYTNNSLVSSPLFDMETITSRDYTKAVSSDDYIYEKIHQQVAKKIEENINVDEAEILKLIDEELDKI